MGLEERVSKTAGRKKLSARQRRTIFTLLLQTKVTPTILSALDDLRPSTHSRLRLSYSQLVKTAKPSQKWTEQFLLFIWGLRQEYDSHHRRSGDQYGSFDRRFDRVQFVKKLMHAEKQGNRLYSTYDACMGHPYLVDGREKPFSVSKSVAVLSDILDGKPPFDELDFIDILTAKKARTLDEAVECSRLNVGHYNAVARIGDGAIKIAYLAVNRYSGDESVFLMIEPNSKGFEHYENIYRKRMEEKGMDEKEIKEAIRQKIYHDEFSGVRLMGLEDPRYVAMVLPPILGLDKEGKKAYFLQAKPYDHTLEDELRAQSSSRPRGLSDEKLLRYTYQLAIALRNCHAAGIVHKDFKPDNVGITKQGNVLLSDFGCASLFSAAGDTIYQYPLTLRPPELAHDDSYWSEQGVPWQSDLFTPEANIWTLGMIAYRMMTGKHLIPPPQHRARPGTKEYHQQNAEVYAKIQDKSFIEKKIDDFGFGGDTTIISLLLMASLRQDPQHRRHALDVFIVASEANKQFGREGEEWYMSDFIEETKEGILRVKKAVGSDAGH